MDDHTTKYCPALHPSNNIAIEEVNYAGYPNRRPRFDPYSTTFNSGWRYHENFSYANQNNVLNPLEMPNKAQEPYPRNNQNRPNIRVEGNGRPTNIKGTYEPSLYEKLAGDNQEL